MTDSTDAKLMDIWEGYDDAGGRVWPGCTPASGQGDQEHQHEHRPPTSIHVRSSAALLINPSASSSLHLVCEGYNMAQATFEVYQDNEDQWRWRLVHDNENIIADGGEGYASRQKCIQGLESVKENAADAEIEDIDTSTQG